MSRRPSEPTSPLLCRWSRTAVASLDVREDGMTLTANESRVWRYGLSVITVSLAIYFAYSLREDPLGRTMSLFIILAAMVVVSWLGPWHRRFHVDPSARRAQLGLRVLGFLPVFEKSFSLDDLRFRSGTARLEISVPDPDAEDGNPLGCAIAMLMGPLGILAALAKSRPMMQVVVSRPALWIESPTGPSQAVLCFTEKEPLEFLMVHLENLLPETMLAASRPSVHREEPPHSEKFL